MCSFINILNVNFLIYITMIFLGIYTACVFCNLFVSEPSQLFYKRNHFAVIDTYISRKISNLQFLQGDQFQLMLA